MCIYSYTFRTRNEPPSTTLGTGASDFAFRGAILTDDNIGVMAEDAMRLAQGGTSREFGSRKHYKNYTQLEHKQIQRR